MVETERVEEELVVIQSMEQKALRRRWTQAVGPLLLLLVALTVSSAVAVGVTRAAARQLAIGADGASAIVDVLPSADADDLDSLPTSDAAPCSSCGPQMETESRDASSTPEKVAAIPVGDVGQTPAREVAKDREKGPAGPGAVSQTVNVTPARKATSNSPLCRGISAYIITVFDEPRHSVATLSTDPRQPGSMRRVGQRYGDYRVVKIDYNRRLMSSSVWLESAYGVCQVLLRVDHPRREKAQRSAVRRYQRQERARERKARAKTRRVRRSKSRRKR